MYLLYEKDNQLVLKPFIDSNEAIKEYTLLSKNKEISNVKILTEIPENIIRSSKVYHDNK